MAVFGDSEEIRYVDRIRAIAFREARDAGASFITRSWVAAKIKRSERFVSEHWNKDPYDAAMDVSMEKLKRDRTLFHRLLESYPSRIKAVLEAKGGHTDY